MADITKEELMAMVEVQSRTAAAMENIANSMRSISEQNKEMMNAQRNIVESCAKCQAQTCEKLVQAVEKTIEDRMGSMATLRSNIEDIKGDTSFMKWVFGGVGLVAGIVLVILKLMGK